MKRNCDTLQRQKLGEIVKTMMEIKIHQHRDWPFILSLSHENDANAIKDDAQVIKWNYELFSGLFARVKAQDDRASP
jgi:hypothetical protein